MHDSDADPKRWRVLLLVGAAELLGMSLWLTASAVSPHLSKLWELTVSQATFLTTVVQIGFVVGTATAAILNLADLIPARWYFAVSALLGALANAALIVSPGYSVALVLRFLTGFFLAGVYPPAMKMIATWFRSGRGLAIGTIVGALTIGTATPHLVRAFEASDYRVVILLASLGAIVAAVMIAAAYRDGPFPFARRAFSWSLAGTVIGHRQTQLAMLGYLGHMWELYAMWVCMPLFLAASLERSGPHPDWLVHVLAFGAIAVGGLGCLWGGWAADRIGRERLVNRAMAASGLCSLVIGLVFGLSPWIVAPVTFVWGFFVVADSAQFSALVTEVAPSHAVGTALTLQTSIGFLLTTVTIQLVPVLAEKLTWQWAFPVLAIGPVAGITAIQRLIGAKASEA